MISISKTPARRKTGARKTAAKKVGIPFTTETRLGVLARDIVTGFEGIVSAKIEMLTGNVQYAIQPKGKADTMVDARGMDFHLLEEIGPGVADKLPAIDATVTIKVGEKVRDTVSGLVGVTIDKTTFQNGCVYFNVQPHAARSKLTGELPGSILVQHGRLRVYRSLWERIVAFFTISISVKSFTTVVRANLKTPPEPAPKPLPKPARRPPGGPSRSMSAQRIA
jgi:hypothetical protein